MVQEVPAGPLDPVDPELLEGLLDPEVQVVLESHGLFLPHLGVELLILQLHHLFLPRASRSQSLAAETPAVQTH